MRKLLIIFGIIGCVLGYGYWHSVTHASYHIQIHFIDGIAGLPATPRSKAEIRFLDSEGRLLADGTVDEEYYYVHLIHPEVGDCHEVEKSALFSKEARGSWQECFQQQSTWIPTWAEKVRKADISTRNCLWKDIPVTVSKRNSDWFLWWVPHPHIGGKPYTYYNTDITVDINNCESVSRPAI